MTKKLAIPLSLIAVAALAACSSPGGPHATRVVGSAESAVVASAGTVTVMPQVRAGVGKISLLTDPTGPLADLSSQVAHLQMFDGTKQVIFVTGTQLTLGECISIRQDSTIRRRPQRDCG